MQVYWRFYCGMDQSANGGDGVALIRGAGVLQGCCPDQGCICRNEGRKKALHKCRALSGWNGLWLVGSGFFDALTFKPFEEISLFFSVLT